MRHTPPIAPVVSVHTVRQIEHTAVRNGISEWTLMEKAGTIVADRIRTMYPVSTDVIAFCGFGNNGGDGFVAAHKLHDAGYTVHIYVYGTPSRLSEAAQIAYQNVIDANIPIAPFPMGTPPKNNAQTIGIDALMGIGYCGTPISDELATVIDEINSLTIPIIAVDIPSGVDADTGHVSTTAVKAIHTDTFIAAKSGLFLGDAKQYTGPISVHPLDLDPAIYQPLAPTMWIARPTPLPQRSPLSHKGNFGHVVIIGGTDGMGGAAILAARGAYRVGAGKVTVVTSSLATQAAVVASVPEAMTVLWEMGTDLTPVLADKTVMILGPGLGTNDGARAIFDQVIDYKIPKIVDADGLNLLAANPRPLQQCILTPHPLEAARLLGISDAKTIQANRLKYAQTLQNKYGATSILKGAHTLIATEPGVWVCPNGNPKMATAGAGDVLSGIIAGLFCSGLDVEDAAIQGVVWHAKWGDIAAQRTPFPALLAGDIIGDLTTIPISRRL